MKIVYTFLLVFNFSILALAAETAFPEEELELPAGLELKIFNLGYKNSPIVQCQRPSKVYVDMLAQLNGIKNRIKSEACRNSGEADAIEQGVSDLQSLVTSKRKTFVDLVKKGTTSGEQLTAKEVESLEGYIDQVVKKASVVTGFLNVEACFDEPAKNSTLGTLSSIIGEISGAVGALAGPFGAKISLGGKIVSGLLGSINTIVQARKDYDQNVEADRVNYLNTLCAYYDFKSDFDKVANAMKYDRRLKGVEGSAKKLLKGLKSNCDKCGVAIEDFENQYYSGSTFEVKARPSIISFSPPPSGSEARVVVEDAPENPLASPPSVVLPTELVTADNLNAKDLTERYFSSAVAKDSVTSDDERLGPDFEGSSVVVKGFDYAEATSNALLTMAWAETERDKIKESEESGASDELRAPIREGQRAIESVLFKKVAPEYVRYHAKILAKTFSDLRKLGRRIVSEMYGLRLQPDPNFDYGKYNSSMVVAFHDLFRDDIKFLESLNPLTRAEPEYQKEFVEIWSGRLIDKFDVLRTDYALAKQRCEFFRNSTFDIKEAPLLRRACNDADREMAEIKTEVIKISMTSFGKEFSYFFKTFLDADKNLTADWLDSVKSHMDQQLKAL